VLNVDLGGGTCKVALARHGAVVETGAINVGARLVAWDPQGRLVRIEDAGRQVAQSLGIPLAMGQVLSPAQRQALAKALADLLFQYLRAKDLSSLAQSLSLTDPLTYHGPVERLVVSGGVGEYVYGHDSRDYGDLGPLLGQEIRARIPQLGIPFGESSEQIRATVIGASQYTVQVSSSTIYLSRPDILPLWNHQVVTPHLDSQRLTPELVAQAIWQALERQDLLETEDRRPIALSIQWPRETSYGELNVLATGIALALGARSEDPWVLVFDGDIGGLVGDLLKREQQVKSEVVVVDEIQVGDLDFIDIGQELGNTRAVPVVVKSLVFG
jgi:ethanolamine utilization protein EutA